ncbi:Phospholipase/Carboxylesterase-domain-containing protein [Jimgerdemannia flammicorona]|uniref:Acyl-protein thioesterase 1 n=1 Tax=Jimgerdemannia flammicorona TaxID=994334 RepID=A0A433D8B6_9FUNG|nr:Phospholipase/Carboxylesterase-domain-containing protein [Jimgerdemannia flammicorona]
MSSDPNIWLNFESTQLASEANKRIPIFQGHGDADAVVNYRFGHQSSKVLQENNYDVRFKTYSGMGHSTSDKELRDVAAFLKEVLPEQAA